jgi:hypothetical protein
MKYEDMTGKFSGAQSPDFYGILASRMLGKFGRKVERS